jgi:aspartyl/asparaginyl beta-hydroxylase (cupin superfamily)
VSWEEGKVITFDDSYRHSVAHNGDSDRVVLAMQIMNPEYLRWRDAGEPQQHRRIDL